MSYDNIAIRRTVSATGVALAIAGCTHGVFEILQGNTPAPGLFVDSIGPAQRFWVEGTDPAFTLVPNFLLTGVLALTLGILAAVWSVAFIHRRHGPAVFLLLFVAQTLVGGGIGYIPYYVAVFLFATRIHAPLGWSQRVLPAAARRPLAWLWPLFLALTLSSWLVGLAVSVTGYFPGIVGVETVFAFVITLVAAAMPLMLIAFCCAIARDLRDRGNAIGSP